MRDNANYIKGQEAKEKIKSERKKHRIEKAIDAELLRYKKELLPKNKLYSTIIMWPNWVSENMQVLMIFTAIILGAGIIMGVATDHVLLADTLIPIIIVGLLIIAAIIMESAFRKDPHNLMVKSGVWTALKEALETSKNAKIVKIIPCLGEFKDLGDDSQLYIELTQQEDMSKKAICEVQQIPRYTSIGVIEKAETYYIELDCDEEVKIYLMNKREILSSLTTSNMLDDVPVFVKS